MEYQGATESGIPLFKPTQESILSDAKQGGKVEPPLKTASNSEAKAVGPKNDPTALMKSMMDTIMESTTKPTGNAFQNCVFNFK